MPLCFGNIHNELKPFKKKLKEERICFFFLTNRDLLLKCEEGTKSSHVAIGYRVHEAMNLKIDSALILEIYRTRK